MDWAATAAETGSGEEVETVQEAAATGWVEKVATAVRAPAQAAVATGWAEAEAMGWTEEAEMGWAEAAAMGWAEEAAMGWAEAEAGWAEAEATGWAEAAAAGSEAVTAARTLWKGAHASVRNPTKTCKLAAAALPHQSTSVTRE